MRMLALSTRIRLLDHIHEADDEEIVLERTDSRLREYGLLPTDRAGDRDAVRGNVVLETALAECVETRQYLWGGVALQTDATAEEVVV